MLLAFVSSHPVAQESRPGSRASRLPFGTVEALVALQGDDGGWPDRQGGGESDRRATALALPALLADGNTMREGQYRSGVRKACKWAQDAQDMDSGRVDAADGDVRG